MGAALAGAARAPITAVVIVFELTGEYSITLPAFMVPPPQPLVAGTTLKAAPARFLATGDS